MLRVRVKKRRGDFNLDAEFELPTPGVAALFGRSGCGKSTLVDLIAGLSMADEGRIELDGEVLLDTAAGIEVPAERRRIGYVFQDARLFPHLRVEANLRYGARRARGTAFIDFDTVVEMLALGPLLARHSYRLSGGERQRIAIGRALLSQPRLLLLDEPLASLDASRREELLPYLETLRDRLAIPMVYVSHQFDEILRLATRVVLIDAGRSLCEGGVAAMSLRPELRSIVGPDAAGAIVDGEVLGRDAASGLARLRVGGGELRVPAEGLNAGARLRVQVLARDVIIATLEPRGLSVRNALRGTVAAVANDGVDADLVTVDVGGALLIARITKAATAELALAPGTRVWALVKSASLRGRLFRAGP